MEQHQATVSLLIEEIVIERDIVKNEKLPEKQEEKLKILKQDYGDDT